eukprot:1215870-Rhodomonas_salina.2
MPWNSTLSTLETLGTQPYSNPLHRKRLLLSPGPHTGDGAERGGKKHAAEGLGGGHVAAGSSLSRRRA